MYIRIVNKVLGAALYSSQALASRDALVLAFLGDSRWGFASWTWQNVSKALLWL